QCSSAGYSAIADLDGDGKPEYIVTDLGIHVFSNDGSLRWEDQTYFNVGAFALLDTDGDGKPEIVTPVHRGPFVIYDALTGQKKLTRHPPPNGGASAGTIAATTSIDPSGPSLAISNNDYVNGTGLLDRNLNLKWYDLVPPMKQGFLDNPSYVALADLLGQGRPQVISHSDYRNLGIQDVLTGQWLEYFSITGGFYGRNTWPIPVDLDGDGRGEIIVNYSLPFTYDNSF